MIHLESLPRPVQPLVAFSTLLRSNGFAVAPEQTMTFIEAVGQLKAESLTVIQRAAHATLAPQHERRAEFDALFRRHFTGWSIAAPARSDGPAEEMQVVDAAPGDNDLIEPDTTHEVGQQASRAEALSQRRFAPVPESDALRRLRREAPMALPSRRCARRMRHHKGDKYDLRRSLRQMVSRDGEVLHLVKLARKRRQRRIVLLIDHSGSMKAYTDSYLRFAHALANVAEQFEVFTLGTRLTRLTLALRQRHAERALTQAAALVADWDGGTRIGEALAAMLAIPRHAGFTRGALVVVLSDGLERGDPGALVTAMRRLAQRAWRVVWLSPLAADPAYEPRTEAMQSIRRYIDRLADGATVSRVCAALLDLAREAP